MSWFARFRKQPAAAAEGGEPAPARKRRWPRVLAGIGIFLALLVAFGFFVAPPIAKSLLEGKASALLGRKVTVGGIRINPLLLTAEVQKLAIAEPDGSQRFVAFDRLFIDLELESVYRRAPVLAEVLLDKPFVHIVRLPGNRFNFTDLIEKFSKPDDPNAEPAKFSVNNIRILGGSVDADDRTVGKQHQVRDLTLSIPFVSNLPYYGNIFVQPAFSAKVNGAPLALQGRSKPFSAGHDTVVDLKFQDVDVPFYLQYAPIDPPWKLARARLDVDANVTFSQPPKGDMRLTVAGMVALRGLQLAALDGKPLLEFQRLEVRTGGVEAFGKTVPLKLVKVTGLAADVHRLADGTLNLAVLGATQRNPGPAAASPPAGEGKAAPAREVTIETLEADATAAFRDDTVDPPFSARLNPVQLQITGLSTSAGAPPANVQLTLGMDSGETANVSGTVGVATKQWELDASLGKFALPRFAPYYRRAVLFEIASGTVGLAAHVSGAAPPEGLRLAVSKGKATLDDLALRRPGQKPFLSVASLAVDGTALDLAKREVVVGDVRITRPAVEARRGKDGTVDLSKLTPPAQGSVPASPDTAPAAPWAVTLKHFLLDQGLARFADAVPASPVDTVISPLRVEVHDLALGTPGKAKLDLKARINGKADVSAAGTFAIEPLGADLKVKIAGFDVTPFQPYFADKLNVTLASASVQADGRVTFAAPKGGTPAIGYEGSAAVARFAATDVQTSEDLLKWDSLFFDQVRLKTEPFALSVGKVALTDFYARLQVNPDGTLNVQGLVKQDPAAEAARTEAPAPATPKKEAKPAAEASPVPRSVKIDQVTLQGGTIDFSDRMVKPNVSAKMTEVGGRVTGLLSDAATRADVDLRGKLSNQSPLSITGQVNPLSGDLFADLKVSFRDIELPPFTPYSGKYAGYTIEKGKLSLDLQYLVEKRQIKAENKVFIDQFTFGEKVESKDAVNLPVQLAVSLLKDREGRINLDVPVSGSLDDPKFKLGRVIWQVIVNLITKAVTAPFALIGSLFGGGSGEELSYLQFAPGSAAPDGAEQKKLEQLAKALRDRPALRLEVTGRVDPDKDPEALRRLAYERKVKAQKFADLTKRGEAPASVDATTVATDEFERYLEKAYKREKFAKPRNAIGFEKDLPREEMEKLMLTHIVVSPDDLRDLAMRRAQAVKDTLTAAEVSAERVFLLEPKTQGEGEGKDKAAASRADFALK